MRPVRPGFLLALLALVVGLAACAPSGDGLADQVATSVAATMQANGQPVPTAEPTLGEVATQAPADLTCANTGLVSVAYVKDGDVWLWVEGGMRTRLTFTTDVEDVAISDNGCRIAYTRSAANPHFNPAAEFPAPETISELWVINSDGAGNHPLADTVFFSALPAPAADNILSTFKYIFQPGTHNLVFTTRVAHPGVGLTLSYDLYRVNADAGAPMPLLPAGAGGGSFAFSPDGSQIALSSNTAIHVLNADGSGLRTGLFTFPSVLTYSEYAYTPPITWSPDGGALLVAIPPEDSFATPTIPDTTLWWIPLDATPPSSPGAVPSVFFAQQEVAFSPDAGRLAYLRPVGVGTGVTELVTALSNGSSPASPLGGTDLRFLGWSPDSNHYLYSYQDGGLQLRVVNASDGSATPLTPLAGSVAAAARAVWADAGRLVLLEMGGSARLSLLHVSGALGELIDTFTAPFASFAVAQ